MNRIQTENDNGPSGSALGLTNSSNITDETSISDVPPRIFGRILSHIPVQEHGSLTQVAPSWHEFIDTQLGVEIKIGQNSEYAENKSITFSPQESLREIGISQCYFSNIYMLDITEFKFPYLLKKLTFIDYVSETNFCKIIHDAYNLRHLILDMSSLHYLPNAADSLSTLNRLQTLEITNGTKFCPWNKKFCKNWVEITFRNTFNLLKNMKIPLLTSLILEFPMNVTESKHFKLADSVIKCLINHYSTVQKFSLTFDDQLLKGKDDEENLVMNITCKELEKVKLSSCTLKFVENSESSNNSSLKNIWISFLHSQNKLQECFVKRTQNSGDCGLPFSPKFILDNSINLRILEWCLDEDSQMTLGTINCELFQNCSNLKELFICSSTNGFAVSTLNNASHLPLSISKLTIERIFISIQDQTFIGLELPNLEVLHLIETGQEGGHGLTMETLKEIMEKKSIKELKIKSCFAVETFQEMSENPGLFSFVYMLIKSKFLNNANATFGIKLQNNKEYALVNY